MASTTMTGTTRDNSSQSSGSKFEPTIEFKPTIELNPTRPRKPRRGHTTSVSKLCSRLSIEVKLDALHAFIKDQNELLSYENLLFCDFLIKAVGLSLFEVPECNVLRNQNKISIRKEINIAVSMPSVTTKYSPIIKSADKKSVKDINKERQSLMLKAKASTLSKKQLSGETFRIVDLSEFSVKQLELSLKTSQFASLGVGSAEQTAVVIGGGVGVATMMTFSLCIDSQVINEYTAAKFLKVLKKVIENPGILE